MGVGVGDGDSEGDSEGGGGGDGERRRACTQRGMVKGVDSDMTRIADPGGTWTRIPTMALQGAQGGRERESGGAGASHARQGGRRQATESDSGRGCASGCGLRGVEPGVDEAAVMRGVGMRGVTRTVSWVGGLHTVGLVRARVGGHGVCRVRAFAGACASRARLGRRRARHVPKRALRATRARSGWVGRVGG